MFDEKEAEKVTSKIAVCYMSSSGVTVDYADSINISSDGKTLILNSEEECKVLMENIIEMWVTRI